MSFGQYHIILLGTGGTLVWTNYRTQYFKFSAWESNQQTLDYTSLQVRCANQNATMLQLSNGNVKNQFGVPEVTSIWKERFTAKSDSGTVLQREQNFFSVKVLKNCTCNKITIRLPSFIDIRWLPLNPHP